MSEGKGSRLTRLIVMILPATLLIGGAAYFRINVEAGAREAAKNYDMKWKGIEGWKEVPHSMMSQFKFKHPEDRVSIIGAIQNVVDDVQVMSELDTDGMAEYSLEAAKRHQKRWKKIERLPNFEAGDNTYSAIMKTEPAHVIVNAYCVKGNTTLLFTLASREPDTATIQKYIGDLKTFLAGVTIIPANPKRLDREN